MNAYEVLDYLINLSEIKTEQTVDTIKAGDGNRQVKKAAVCFIATPEVIKAAHEWGADLLITHE
ncbi:MAG: transcriptional regulator, partial [Clostridia bacterium]|nr:transcriptional regulator [Clostridia bacterium]